MKTYCIIDKKTGLLLYSFEVIIEQREYDQQFSHNADLTWEHPDNVDEHFEFIHSDDIEELTKTIDLLKQNTSDIYEMEIQVLKIGITVETIKEKVVETKYVDKEVRVVKPSVEEVKK